MKSTVWKKDWFWGLGVSLFFLVVSQSSLLESLEYKAYDLGIQASNREPSDKVAIIAIDDESIANIGRWPWPRDIQARLIDILSNAGAKVIVNTILYIEPQIDTGRKNINRLIGFFNRSSFVQKVPGETAQLSELLAEAQSALQSPVAKRKAKSDKYFQIPYNNLKTLVEFLRTSSFARRLYRDISTLANLLREADSELNADRKLALSVRKAGNVALGMTFDLGEPLGNPDAPLPDYVKQSTLTKIVDRANAHQQKALPPASSAIYPPIEEIGRSAWGIGHVNWNVDLDGVVRTHPLVIRYYDSYFPSLALLAAAKGLNLGVQDIHLRLGQGVQLGALQIPTDPELEVRMFFYPDRNGRPAFPIDAFYDVVEDKIPPEKYRDKVVLIGTTALGVGTSQITPIAPNMAPVLTLAHTVSSLLNQDFLVVPEWSWVARALVFLAVAVYLILLLPRLHAAMAAVATGLVLITLLAAEFYLLVGQAMWVKLMVPATLLVVGHLLLTTKCFLVAEKDKEQAAMASAESNRMLGLALQQQGQLDMAFEKFRKVRPVDDALLDVLYSLSLDFERKRQFSKAGNVLHYIAEHQPNFRDVPQKIECNQARSETLIFGGGTAGNGSGPPSLILNGGSLQKPMLGRYEVEKELGKGAMGLVYLGRDPKINRIVAIKTLALSQEFEDEDLEDVRYRFFREAETAGRLNHPNIVTIYDAGEEHDLAYIAMELLKGKDLTYYTKLSNLLPVPTVLQIIMAVAEALDFAHAQNIVHRDIKPANIMYDPKKRIVKVTDFGIARITDSSKTRTGLVLGTPSYMSPEQLAGKKVDGRSDIFSLGVTLFQLVTGRLPFHSESMATLMFKITNKPHQDPRQLRTDLPPCVSAIVDKALAKEADARYQTAGQLIQDLRRCLAEIG